jgi:hypothetical protein
MPVPTLITDLSTTIASNSPAGSESPASLDDYQRAHAAFIAQLNANKAELAGSATQAFSASTFTGALNGNAATATTATTAANLSGGSGGTIPYQTGAGTTAMLANGTAGQLLQSNGTTAAPSWVASPTTAFASSAENAAGTIENKAVDPLGIREAFNATGTAPVYACRAWVSLNGSGTVAILASGNVSSITDNGVGDYTANFTTALPGDDYSICGTAGNGTNIALLGIFPGANFSRLVGSCRIQTATHAGLQDCSITSLAFFR